MHEYLYSQASQTPLRRGAAQKNWTMSGRAALDLITLPDFGYNAKYSVDMETNEVVIKQGARKPGTIINDGY